MWCFLTENIVLDGDPDYERVVVLTYCLQPWCLVSAWKFYGFDLFYKQLKLELFNCYPRERNLDATARVLLDSVDLLPFMLRFESGYWCYCSN